MNPSGKCSELTSASRSSTPHKITIAQGRPKSLGIPGEVTGGETRRAVLSIDDKGCRGAGPYGTSSRSLYLRRDPRATTSSNCFTVGGEEASPRDHSLPFPSVTNKGSGVGPRYGRLTAPRWARTRDFMNACSEPQRQPHACPHTATYPLWGRRGTAVCTQPRPGSACRSGRSDAPSSTPASDGGICTRSQSSL